MNRRLIAIAFFISMIIIVSAFCQQSVFAADNGKAARLKKAYEALSTARVYIEHYYMQVSDYPKSLAELERDLNSLLPKNLPRLRVPLDPATGREFIYTRSKDRKSYTLKVPEPSKYGVDKIVLKNADWAGFNVLVRERVNWLLRTENLKRIEAIAFAVEHFIKENGKPPESLSKLIPKYFKALPVDPLSGSKYLYKTNGKVYVIESQKPEKYGLKKLKFSSTRGWITK